jgi:hypothetical protein
MAEAAASRASAGPAAASRRVAPGRRRATVAARGKPRFRAGFRWARVALLVAVLVVGLPLAHAMFGEVAALLGGAVALGFLLGRWTAPGRG